MGVCIERAASSVFGENHRLFHNFETVRKFPSVVPRMVDCRNKLARTCLSILYLQEVKYLQERLSLLVWDDLHPSVVTLQPLDVQEIFSLALCFDKQAMQWSELEALTSTAHLYHSLTTLTDSCALPLKRLNCWPRYELQPVSSACIEEQIACWSRTVDILNLAVLLFCQEHLAQPGASMTQNIPFVGNFSLPSGDICGLAKLNCLSAFLNHRHVWVLQPFHTQRTSVTRTNHVLDDPIYLCTYIETFDEIWGPVREVQDHNKIIQFNVGLGAIVPWKDARDESARSSASKIKARICHWLPFNLLRACSGVQIPARPERHEVEHQDFDEPDSLSSDLETVSSHSSQSSAFSLSHSETNDSGICIEHLAAEPSVEELREWTRYARSNPLSVETLLLIGANTKFIQTECKCSAPRFYNHYKKKRSLHYLESRRLHAKIEKGPFGLSLGYQGNGLRQDFPIKKDHRYFKDFLLDKWEHYRQICHPEQLQVRGGVLVLMCTRNAIRCSILDLLETPSIKKILTLAWSSHEPQDTPHEFLESSLSSEEILALWNMSKTHRKWIGDFLLLCLHQLKHTGFDPDRKEFNVMWMHQENGHSKRVVLDPTRHSWVQTLRDGEDSCAMAVLTEKCFGINDENGRLQSCGCPGKYKMPSRLETILQVDTRLPPFDQIRVMKQRKAKEAAQTHHGSKELLNPTRRSFVDVSDIQPGTHVSIADPHHRLTVIKALSEQHLLLKWDSSLRQAISDALRYVPARGQGHLELWDDREVAEGYSVLMHVQ